MVSNIAQLAKWYLSFSEKRKNDFFFSLKLEQNLCEQVSYKNIQWTPQLKYNRRIYAITLTVYVKDNISNTYNKLKKKVYIWK